METISPALRIRQLVKVFTRPAVDCIDLTVARGEFYALLGPNGAGKTTTLRMISGLLLPDRGCIEVFGLNVVTQPRQAIPSVSRLHWKSSHSGGWRLVTIINQMTGNSMESL